MHRKLKTLFFILIIVTACDSGNDDNQPDSGLSAYQTQVITYFKEIALGFEFGNASKITRKWDQQMKIFVGGSTNADLFSELGRIINELNELATDGFSVEIVNDPLQSNYYIFFGSGNDYKNIYPSQSGLVGSNLGLFSVFWDGQNHIYTGHMYVNIFRADLVAQKHLLREELTQSLGLGNDSEKYQDSIFQSAWTTVNEYSEIDRDVIRFLYHPEMTSGLDASQAETVIKNIFLAA